MVQKGIEAEVLSSLVMFMVRDLLVNHGNWKYQQPYQRWQITTQVLNYLIHASIYLQSHQKRRGAQYTVPGCFWGLGINVENTCNAGIAGEPNDTVRNGIKNVLWETTADRAGNFPV